MYDSSTTANRTCKTECILNCAYADPWGSDLIILSYPRVRWSLRTLLQNIYNIPICYHYAVKYVVNSSKAKSSLELRILKCEKRSNIIFGNIIFDRRQLGRIIIILSSSRVLLYGCVPKSRVREYTTILYLRIAI